MDTPQVIDMLNEIEALFPVATWEIEGVHIWPLVRIQLAWSLRSSAPDQKKSSRWTRAFASASNAIRNKARYYYARSRDREHEARPDGEVYAVFLGDGISRCLLKDSWYDKLCDPFVDIFSKAGKACFHLEPNNYYHVPRYRPSMFIAWDLFMIRLKTLLSRASAEGAQIAAGGYLEFLTYARSKGVYNDLLELGAVGKQIHILLSMSRYFRRLLSILKPKLGFVVDYPALEGLAFCHACRALAIPSVVIQHGVQDHIHAAYGRWNQVPGRGYETLPSIFWCWTKEDAAVINEWNRKTFPLHQAIAGGNLFLKSWERGDIPYAAEYNARFERLKSGRTADGHILVTLQYGFADRRHLEPLFLAMKNGPPRWQWWIRLHPLMLQDKTRIMDLLAEFQVTNYEIDEATMLPLYSVLANVDVHVTLHSAVVAEAESFGVPSVIVGSAGTSYFEKQLRWGTAVAAFTDIAIIQAIGEMLHKRRQTAKSRQTISGGAPDPMLVLLAAGQEVRTWFDQIPAGVGT